MPASVATHRGVGLAVLAAALVGWEQPRAVARLSDVGPRRLTVLRRHYGRGVSHRRLGEEAGRLGELGVGVLAALAIGVGSADAGNAQDGDGGANGDVHGQSPR